jgi:hypothetical protein
MANGQIITRSMGYAILRVDKAETVGEVVFAQKGDLQLLGARALEGLNLKVDPRSKRLVATGPIVVAVAVRQVLENSFAFRARLQSDSVGRGRSLPRNAPRALQPDVKVHRDRRDHLDRCKR